MRILRANHQVFLRLERDWWKTIKTFNKKCLNILGSSSVIHLSKVKQNNQENYRAEAIREP